jgi:hypothetical protein
MKAGEAYWGKIDAERALRGALQFDRDPEDFTGAGGEKFSARLDREWLAQFPVLQREWRENGRLPLQWRDPNTEPSEEQAKAETAFLYAMLMHHPRLSFPGKNGQRELREETLPRGWTILDLISDAFWPGLVQAQRTFDPAKGARFATWGLHMGHGLRHPSPR